MIKDDKYRILLIEDDKFISRAYKDGFQMAGFDIEQAFDGVEALKKAKEKKFDLILLDLILPIKDGFEILAEFKMDVGLKKIPVMILSNLGQAGDVERAKDLGAKDYLIKSNFSLKEVIKRAKECIAKKQ